MWLPVGACTVRGRFSASKSRLGSRHGPPVLLLVLPLPVVPGRLLAPGTFRFMLSLLVPVFVQVLAVLLLVVVMAVTLARAVSGVYGLPAVGLSGTMIARLVVIVSAGVVLVVVMLLIVREVFLQVEDVTA